MSSMLRPAIVLFVLLSIVTGIIYPLAITGIAQVAFPFQANGSMIPAADGSSGMGGIGGAARGSRLIGQAFDDPKCFWGRLSATGPVAYTAFNADTLTGSSGSNYGPLHLDLVKNAQARIDALRSANAALGLPDDRPVPIDLVTSSGSGLDPHISPAAAEYQVQRVARARGIDETVVRDLVAQHTSGRQLGVFGEPVVNVLLLNQALDAQPSK